LSEDESDSNSSSNGYSFDECDSSPSVTDSGGRYSITFETGIVKTRNFVRSMNFEIPDEHDLISRFIRSTPAGNVIDEYSNENPIAIISHVKKTLNMRLEDGHKPSEIHRDMHGVYGDDSAIPQNVRGIEAAILNDRRVQLRALSQKFNISYEPDRQPQGPANDGKLGPLNAGHIETGKRSSKYDIGLFPISENNLP
ncbi:hypothetical protein L9F63_008729, partial [Diploptera punctata]